jgi:hypothetical protein
MPDRGGAVKHGGSASASFGFGEDLHQLLAHHGALCRCLALRVEPTPENLHADPVSDCGLAHPHPQLSEPVADLLDPGVFSPSQDRRFGNLPTLWRPECIVPVR